MPIFNALLKYACCVAGEQEEDDIAAPVRLPTPEPAAPGYGEPGRPHQDFVEDEARKYWQDMVNPGSLVKPGQDEIRAAAMPILCAALRRRTGWSPWNRAHQGVNAMQLRYLDKGWIKHPYTPSEACPDYVEALVQLADDADLIAREIPLPAHPGPQHPPIYYETDPVSKLPIPRSDALIRANYVHDPVRGGRITQHEYIHPWPSPERLLSARDIASRGWDVCYNLHPTDEGSVLMEFHFIVHILGVAVTNEFPVTIMPFTPCPPPK